MSDTLVRNRQFSDWAEPVEISIPVAEMPPWANPGYLLNQAGDPSVNTYTRFCPGCLVRWRGGSICWMCGRINDEEAL